MTISKLYPKGLPKSVAPCTRQRGYSGFSWILEAIISQLLTILEVAIFTASKDFFKSLTVSGSMR